MPPYYKGYIKYNHQLGCTPYVNLWIIQWNGISFVSNGHSWNLMSYIFSGFVVDLPGFDPVISVAGP